MTTRQLRSIVSQFRKGLLGNRSSEGMCYAICLPLQAYLAFLGFNVAMVGGEVERPGKWDYCEHYWLKTNRIIIDPTADQFGGPRVLIGKKPKHYREEEVWDLEEKK